MGRSVRSKKMKANRARLRERYAPRELAKLKQTVANLPLPEKTEMEFEAIAEEPETSKDEPQVESGNDVAMGGAETSGSGEISKTQMKKKLAAARLKKKGAKVQKLKTGKKKNTFRF